MLLLSMCICTFAIISQCSGAGNLPKFVTTCKRFDPNISKCMKSNIERFGQYSDIAIPEFNISRIDPWKSPSIFTLTKGRLHADASNIEFADSKNFKVTGISIRLQSNLIKLKLLFPKIIHKCTVTLRGNFLHFTLGKEGYIEGYADLTLCMKLQGERLFKNGREHIHFNDIGVTALGKNFYAELHHLSEGTPAEKSAFKTILVDHVDFFLPMYNEFAKKTIGYEIANLFKNVYDAYSLDDLHPK